MAVRPACQSYPPLLSLVNPAPDQPDHHAAAPLQSTERLQLKHTAEEREAIQGFAAQYASEIGELLQRLPRPLLLLLKTNDCLRCGAAGHGPPQAFVWGADRQASSAPATMATSILPCLQGG